MKNPIDSIPEELRPYALLAIVLIPVLAVWSVYHGTVRRQADEIERLRQASPEAQVMQEPETAPSAATAPAPRGGSAAGSDASTQFAAPSTEWRAAVSPDGTFQVNLPPGTKLILSEGTTYVMADPTPAGALPIMAIKKPSELDKQQFKPGTATSLMLKIGTQDYWFYTWQFKAWEPFSRVVSSFQVLE